MHRKIRKQEYKLPGLIYGQQEYKLPGLIYGQEYKVPGSIHDEKEYQAPVFIHRPGNRIIKNLFLFWPTGLSTCIFPWQTGLRNSCVFLWTTLLQRIRIY